MAHAEPAPRPWWRDLAAGLAFALVVSVPTLVLAENWHGSPIIDQPGLGWVVPAVLVPGAFVVGGALAGWHRRRWPGALGFGLFVGIGVLAVLVPADLVRRATVPEDLAPLPVVRLWVVAGGGAAVLAAVGGGAGRMVRRSMERRSTTGPRPRRPGRPSRRRAPGSVTGA